MCIRDSNCTYHKPVGLCTMHNHSGSHKLSIVKSLKQRTGNGYVQILSQMYINSTSKKTQMLSNKILIKTVCKKVQKNILSFILPAISATCFSFLTIRFLSFLCQFFPTKSPGSCLFPSFFCPLQDVFW